MGTNNITLNGLKSRIKELENKQDILDNKQSVIEIRKLV